MEKYIFGIDIGGTSVKSGLFSGNGDMVGSMSISTRKEDHGRNVLSDTARLMKSQLSEKGLSFDCVEGIGICVPGPVTKGTTVNGCVNIGWNVVNVKRELSHLTGIDNIVCANDANAAAAGEMWKGAGKGCSDLMMITLGTGVGGGIISSGRTLEGTFGSAGEIGHMYVLPDPSDACRDRESHWLEYYTAAAGIVRRAEFILKNEEYSSSVLHVLKKAGDLSAKDVFDAAAAGDNAALRTAEFTGDVLGKALAAAACVIDPEKFIIGGGIALAGDTLLDPVRTAYRKYAFHPSEDTPIEAAALGSDAGMTGCAKLIIDR